MEERSLEQDKREKNTFWMDVRQETVMLQIESGFSLGHKYTTM